MADRYRDDRDTNYFRESYGQQDASRYRDDRGGSDRGGNERGLGARIGDEVKSWVGDDDAARRRDRDQGGYGSNRSEYGYGPSAGSGYGNDRDTRAGYSGYAGRDYSDRYADRSGRSEGQGEQGRNWAARAGDEVKSWVGDDSAEARRERDRQQFGRYPGENAGERRYGADDRTANYGSQRYGQDTAARTDLSSYGRGDYGAASVSRGDYTTPQAARGDYGSTGYRAGDYGSSRYSEGQGYGGRTAPTSGYGDTRATVAGAYGEPRGDTGYSARSSSYSPSTYSAYDDRGSNRMPTGGDYNADDRGFLAKAGDEVKSWFGDDEAERRRKLDAQRSDAQSAFSGGSAAGMTGYDAATGAATTGTTTPHDHHYAEYRKARAEEYDRDYHEYKQSKSKDFHEDFHSFRTKKAGGNNDATGIGTSAAATAYGASAMSGMGTSGMGTSSTSGSGMGTSSAGSSGFGASSTGGTTGAQASGASSSAGSQLTGAAAQVKEHMVVVGSDGQGVGKVDHIAGSDLKLTKHDSTDGKHHLIPGSWVASVEGDKVKLNKTSDEAMREWRTAEPTQKQA